MIETATQERLENLVDMVWDAVAARSDRRTGKRIAKPEIILQQETVSVARFSSSFPVLQHLGEAIRLGKAGALGDICARLEEVLPNLAWSQNATYTSENCSASFLDGYAYAGLAGSDGPLFWAAPLTGVMLMGPNILYPGHHHEAREIYLPLVPGTQWRLDNGEWFEADVGELIFHDAWQMHEMRTLDRPMLALAGWIDVGDRGGIAWDPDRQGAVT